MTFLKAFMLFHQKKGKIGEQIAKKVFQISTNIGIIH
jgi:hypothetical protein